MIGKPLHDISGNGEDENTSWLDPGFRTKSRSGHTGFVSCRMKPLSLWAGTDKGIPQNGIELLWREPALRCLSLISKDDHRSHLFIIMHFGCCWRFSFLDNFVDILKRVKGRADVSVISMNCASFPILCFFFFHYVNICTK